MCAILVTGLIGLLVLCPQLCGGDGLDQAAHQHDTMHSPDGPSPAHCPGDADDCICQGAVPAANLRVMDVGFSAATGILASLIPPPLCLDRHINQQGPLTGLARWGTPLDIRRSFRTTAADLLHLDDVRDASPARRTVTAERTAATRRHGFEMKERSMKRPLSIAFALVIAAGIIGLGVVAAKPAWLPSWKSLSGAEPVVKSEEAGLFCKEHGVPEKFCTLCHEELATS